MATNRNIQMNYFNGVDYDVLNPRTTVGNISDWNSAIYSKGEVDSKINTVNSSINNVNSKVGNLQYSLELIVSGCVFNVPAKSTGGLFTFPFNLLEQMNGYEGLYVITSFSYLTQSMGDLTQTPLYSFAFEGNGRYFYFYHTFGKNVGESVTKNFFVPIVNTPTPHYSTGIIVFYGQSFYCGENSNTGLPFSAKVSGNGISLFQTFSSYNTTTFRIRSLYANNPYPKDFQPGISGTISFYKYKYIINS